MYIFGLTGPIGHGKSTFSDALHTLLTPFVHFESSEIISEVADKLHESLSSIPNRDDITAINNWLSVLPQILSQLFQVSCEHNDIFLTPENVAKHPIEYEKLFLHLDNLAQDPKMVKTKITPENKESYRPILQWLGGYLTQKIDPGIWYNEIARRLKELDAGQFKLCTVAGLRYPEDVAILRREDAKIIKVYRPGFLQYDKLDPTERERDNIKPDITIVSDSDKAAITRCASQFVQDLEAGTLSDIYYASRA